jgi:hypothetical protein
MECSPGMRTIGAFAVAVILAGCASFDGRGLVPGQSRAADVEALMGTPADRVTQANGDTLLYYSRLPEGRKTYVATIGSNGLLRGIEQRLNYENIGKVVPNATTAKEVRLLLGPPYRITRMDRLQRDVWEYPWKIAEERRILWVQVSRDGVVREVIEMHDFESDPPSGSDDSGKD